MFAFSLFSRLTSTSSAENGAGHENLDNSFVGMASSNPFVSAYLLRIELSVPPPVL